MNKKELLEALEKMGYLQCREVGDFGICGLYRFAFTVAIVCGLDSTGYQHRYCFPDWAECLRSFENWDGQTEHPDGPWIKRKGGGRGFAVDYSNPALNHNS